MADATPAATAATGIAAPTQLPLPDLTTGSGLPAVGKPPAEGMGAFQRPPETKPETQAAPAEAAADKTTAEPAKPADAAETQEGSKPGAKEGADKPASPLALKFAEGVVPDPKLIGLAQVAVDKFGLSPEGAQALADGFTAYQQQAEQERVQDWEQTQKQWVEALKADKAFGGANYEKNRLLAVKALSKFDPAGELLSGLTENGFLNWPPLVRALASVGAAAAEDRVAAPVTPDAPRISTEEERLRARYPNSPQMRP